MDAGAVFEVLHLLLVIFHLAVAGLMECLTCPLLLRLNLLLLFFRFFVVVVGVGVAAASALSIVSSASIVAVAAALPASIILSARIVAAAAPPLVSLSSVLILRSVLYSLST